MHRGAILWLSTTSPFDVPSAKLPHQSRAERETIDFARAYLPLLTLSWPKKMRDRQSHLIYHLVSSFFMKTYFSFGLFLGEK